VNQTACTALAGVIASPVLTGPGGLVPARARTAGARAKGGCSNHRRRLALLVTIRPCSMNSSAGAPRNTLTGEKAQVLVFQSWVKQRSYHCRAPGPHALGLEDERGYFSRRDAAPQRDRTIDPDAPNLLFILSDNHNQDLPGCQGDPLIRMPCRPARRVPPEVRSGFVRAAA